MSLISAASQMDVKPCQAVLTDVGMCAVHALGNSPIIGMQSIHLIATKLAGADSGRLVRVDTTRLML